MGGTARTTAARVGDLTPAPYNPRTISPQRLEILSKTMAAYGDLSGIVFNRRTGRLVGGHQRMKHLDPSWKISKSAVKDKVGTIAAGHIDTPMGRWAYREVDWPEDKELAANLAANNPAGEWDIPLLKDMVVQLDTGSFDIELTGFTALDLEELFGGYGRPGKTDDDSAPALPTTPKTKPGDIYLMGPHRLICGDSLDEQVIETLLAGKPADMIWTDPPYNVAYESKAGKIMNDNMAAEKFWTFTQRTVQMLYTALKPGGIFYIAHAEGNEMSSFLRRALIEHLKMEPKQCLIWVKNAPVLGRQDYNWKHEPILYGWKAGAAHYFNQDFTQSTVIDDDINLKGLSKRELIALVHSLREAVPASVLREDKPPKSDLHPTQKPVALISKNITASSRPGEIVADIFGGSGSTLIACEKTLRQARLCELDPKFCDVIVQRWEEFTGKTAERIRG